MVIVTSLFPVFALIVLGRILRHRGLADDAFFRQSDRLVYFIFFPALLFWKVAGASGAGGIEWRLLCAALLALAVIYLASAVHIHVAVPANRAGSFSQSCYRFNTYVGMAIVISVTGDEGVHHFGILISALIPAINVLAVSTLIWFSRGRLPLRERMALTLKSLAANPLLLACVAGVLYGRLCPPLPAFLEATFRMATSVTLPLALLSIGGALTFATLDEYFPAAAAGAAFKLILLPAVGYGFLRLLGVEGTAFTVGMIFFALPTSTAIYVLSAQLGSSTELASAAVAVSTLASGPVLALVLWYWG